MQQVFHIVGLDIDWGFTLTFFSLILVRLLMVCSTIPFLVGKPVPAAIKVGLSLTLAVFLYPMLVPQAATLPQDRLILLALFVKEAFFGMVIGLTAALVFFSFEAAGRIIDNQRGAAQARLLIPALGEQGSIFGSFYFQLGIIIFLVIGGHLLFLQALLESYQTLPLLAVPQGNLDLMGMVDLFIQITGQVLYIAVQIAAPVFIAIFLADMILGITNRIAPSINVWEMGFAIRGVLGVIVLYLSLGLVISQFSHYTLAMVHDVQRMIRYLH